MKRRGGERRESEFDNVRKLSNHGYARVLEARKVSSVSYVSAYLSARFER